MMIKFTSFNPFYGIIETKRFPHARTLRTSFSEKMSDAFTVLFGEHEKEPTYPGLFDYATFFLRYFFLPFIEWLLEKNTITRVIGVLLLIIIAPIMITIVLATSLIWFIMALPVVGVLHLASIFFANDDKEQALNVTGQETNGEEHTLRHFLEQNKMQMNDIIVASFTGTNTEPTTASDVYNLSLSKKTNDENTTTPQFTAKCTARQALAFFRLNIGNITGQCEERRETDIINTCCPTA